MTWHMLNPAGRIAAIKAVHEPGMSASVIAAAIPGCPSRNAIIGMYSRHRARLADCPLRPRGSNGGTPKQCWEQPQPSAKLAETVRQRATVPNPVSESGNTLPRSGDASRAEYACPKMAQVCADVLPPRNLTLMELERNDCRWPVAYDGEHLFCGHPKKHGSYCRGHFRLSSGRGTESERSADRVLKAIAA